MCTGKILSSLFKKWHVSFNHQIIRIFHQCTTTASQLVSPFPFLPSYSPFSHIRQNDPFTCKSDHVSALDKTHLGIPITLRIKCKSFPGPTRSSMFYPRLSFYFMSHRSSFSCTTLVTWVPLLLVHSLGLYMHHTCYLPALPPALYLAYPMASLRSPSSVTSSQSPLHPI